jgi:hypothetical protein
MDKLVKWLMRVNMLRLLLFMHHVAPCTLWITHFILSHTYAFATSRSRGAGAEDPKGSMVVNKRPDTWILT